MKTHFLYSSVVKIINIFILVIAPSSSAAASHITITRAMTPTFLFAGVNKRANFLNTFLKNMWLLGTTE